MLQIVDGLSVGTATPSHFTGGRQLTSAYIASLEGRQWRHGRNDGAVRGGMSGRGSQRADCPVQQATAANRASMADWAD